MPVEVIEQEEEIDTLLSPLKSMFWTAQLVFN